MVIKKNDQKKPNQSKKTQTKNLTRKIIPPKKKTNYKITHTQKHKTPQANKKQTKK